MVLYHVLDTFPAHFYSERSANIVQLMIDAEESHVTLVDMFRALGEALIDSPPPQDQRLQLLNDTWSHVTKVDNLELYLSCAAAYTDLIALHYSVSSTDLAQPMSHSRCSGAGSENLTERYCQTCEASSPIS